MTKCRKLEKEMAKMLSEDLISEVLVRLPVKSLLRFRCVCKAWFNLIKSPNFIDMHLQLSTTKTDCILLSRNIGYRKNIISIHDYESFNLVTSFDLDPEVEHDGLRICGPCNGLLCLLDMDKELTLYNPSLHKSKALPRRPFPCRKGWKCYVKGFGFGFVSNPKDYKVISLVSFDRGEDDDNDDEDIGVDEDISEDDDYDEHIVDNEDDDDDLDEYNVEDEDAPAEKVEIYDLSTNSWREIECDCPYSIDSNENGTLFNGALHWTAQREGIDIIISFNMSTEVFREMELPNDILGKNRIDKSLTLVNNSLALFAYTSYHDKHNFIDIWVMKEENGVSELWTKQFSIGPVSGINRPLMLWKNEAILLESYKGLLLSCALDTHEIEDREIQGDWTSLRVMVFQESLISPNGLSP